MSTSGMTLVTGATGFVGQHLCEALVARGAPVRGMTRSGSGTMPAGVETALVADLTDRQAVRRAMRSVDAVVHLAARVHVLSETSADPLAEFRRTNVEGTRVLLEEAAEAGVRSFVFVSSVKAVGEASVSPWNEETPPAPVDPYGISKLEAEQMIRAHAPRHGLHAPILRLPLVYGPGMRANMLRLFRLVDRGVPLPFGSAENRRSLAFVGNVVAAAEAVLASPAAGAETFFVSDGDDLSTPELIRGIAAALGRPHRLLPVPVRLLRAVGRAGDLAARVRPVGITSGEVERLVGSLAVDSSRLWRLAGGPPPYGVHEGLRRTAGWYRSPVGARA